MKKLGTTLTSSVYSQYQERNLLYVDKTEYLYSLITSDSNMYFCSRPRRFGKTLLVSTLESIFKGEKELFKGRYIYNTDYDWKEYPVIRMDFSGMSTRKMSDFQKQICFELRLIAKRYQLEFDKDDFSIPEIALRNLIYLLYHKFELPVIVLIDEYDSPLLSNISKPNAKEIRDILKDFYATIKKSEDYLRFVYITGITKFSKMSIFSAMNKLVDISIDDKYSTMFGFTEKELLHYFDLHITEGAEYLGMDRADFIARVRDTYDGYRFSPNAERVYNPISINSFFTNGSVFRFDNYWMETGSTSFVMDIAKSVDFDIATDFDEPVDRNSLSSFDMEQLQPDRMDSNVAKLILLQSGYLTIKKSEGNSLYLGFPNIEVASSFSWHLLHRYGLRYSNDIDPVNLKKAFDDNDYEGIRRFLVSYYAALPYDVYGDMERRTEKFYQSLLFAILFASRIKHTVEDKTNSGRIDISIETKRCVYILELKKDGNARDAISQIKDKRYKDKFLSLRKRIVAIGVVFSDDERNITEWIVEEI